MFQDVLIKMKVENNKQVDYFLDFKNNFIHIKDNFYPLLANPPP